MDLIYENLDRDLSELPDYLRGEIDFGGLCQEIESGAFGDIPDYEDVSKAEMIPESQWPDLCGKHSDELLNGVRMIFDQGREPSCTANAIAGAAQFRGYWQFGESLYRKLSAVSLYHRIKLRGGGSFISQGMTEARDNGLLPLDDARNKADFEHTHPARGEDLRLPNGWQRTAKQFRLRFSKANTLAAMVSALLRNKPMIGGRQGHAIYYCRPLYSRGDLVFDYPNSWRETWGNQGHGYDSRRTVERMDMFVVESITVRDECQPVAIDESQSETLIA